MRRRSLLVPVVLYVSSFAAALHGCSSDDAVATGADAAVSEAAAVDRRAPPATSDAGPGPDAAGVCAPESVSSFKATWAAPAPLHAAKCTFVQVATFADCAYGHAGYDQAKCTAFKDDAANADCIACAAPKTRNGPTLVTDISTNVNYGACVAALTGDTATGSCGAAIDAAEQCRAAACGAACPVTPGNDAQYKAYTKCLEDAWTGVCGSYATATSCADDARKGVGPAAACYPSTSDFGQLLGAYVTLFCGSAATDGGSDAKTDAPSDGASDAKSDG